MTINKKRFQIQFTNKQKLKKINLWHFLNVKTKYTQELLYVKIKPVISGHTISGTFDIWSSYMHRCRKKGDVKDRELVNIWEAGKGEKRRWIERRSELSSQQS